MTGDERRVTTCGSSKRMLVLAKFRLGLCSMPRCQQEKSSRGASNDKHSLLQTSSNEYLKYDRQVLRRGLKADCPWLGSFARLEF